MRAGGGEDFQLTHAVLVFVWWKTNALGAFKNHSCDWRASSLPALRNDLARVCERKARAPSKCLAAVPSVAEVEPVTIFHEPINIRAENVERIQSHVGKPGVKLKTGVFETCEHHGRDPLVKNAMRQGP